MSKVKKYGKFYVHFFSLLLVTTSFAKDDVSKKVFGLSALFADLEIKNGQRVCVRGVLRLEFEGTALFSSEKEYKEDRAKNALWLDISKYKIEPNKSLKGLEVVVCGQYRPDRRGHMGRYKAELQGAKIEK
ncbi:hypothetical protein ACES2I_15605 [Bdellovibrio bacteriovorus]|uniref:hypothetical protein n=1 Tax=Bdellovibrio bacteriovorus TaxID=959 RepID=UPI0035A6CF63